eukprot:1935866-Rhodomonas_salina.1
MASVVLRSSTHVLRCRIKRERGTCQYKLYHFRAQLLALMRPITLRPKDYLFKVPELPLSTLSRYPRRPIPSLHRRIAGIPI